MKIQYYHIDGKLYVPDGIAKYKELAMYIDNEKAQLMVNTSFRNNHLFKAKEITPTELTPEHFCVQTHDDRFQVRKTQLEKMGFTHDGVDFRLQNIWSCYWEQVYHPTEEKWYDYLMAIEEAHNNYYIKKI